MGTIIAVMLWEWGQTPREYRVDGVRVCGIPAVMGIWNNYIALISRLSAVKYV